MDKNKLAKSLLMGLSLASVASVEATEVASNQNYLNPNSMIVVAGCGAAPSKPSTGSSSNKPHHSWQDEQTAATDQTATAEDTDENLMKDKAAKSEHYQNLEKKYNGA